MIPVAITIAVRRRWWLQKKVWRGNLPESWAEVPPARSQAFFRMLCTTPLPEALASIAQQSLGIPNRWWRHLEPMHQATLSTSLGWMEPKADSAQCAVTEFRHRGRRWWMPAPKGEDLTFAQFLVADSAFEAACEGKPEATTLLLAALCRPLRHTYPEPPLRGRGEAEQRAELLGDAPEEVKMAALLYFAGVKAYVRKTYGRWLFDEEDAEQPDDETDEDEEDYDDDDDLPPEAQATQGPNFGWYGILQDVAEAGLFGDLRSVQQTSLHDVLVYLVRQVVKIENMNLAQPSRRANDY